uniref:Uncharacterized protein n=1 Tax=Anopheles epiroticus TaxID=199890 RepID=A0A182PLZ7_9DIPT
MGAFISDATDKPGVRLLDSAGILQKWSKLRRRCASFKSVSGPASLDSDTNFILAEHPGHYQIISTATGSPIAPRAVPPPSHKPSSHHQHPLYHGHHHHHQLHPHHHQHHRGATHPHHHHQHHPHHHHHSHHHNHHLHHQQLHHHPLVDYPLPGSHLLDVPPPPLASGYDLKNWELRHSSSSSASASSSSTIGAPPAIPATTAAGLGIPSDDYWHHFAPQHEPSDVKLWRLGAHQTYAHRIHVNPPQRRSAHSIDWEYNVQRYENMCDNMAPPQRIFRTEKLQYYDELSDTAKRTAAATPEPGHESTGGVKVAKEIKLPSLKTFKSASMRLPGQKSSIHEVQQLLRSKFNRIHAGLRKRRALSVQEVFQIPGTPGPGIQATPTKPTFYVPSPLVSERTPHRGGLAPRYNEEDEGEDARATFLDASRATDRPEDEEEEGPVSLPYISEAMLAPETAAVKQVTLRSTDHSPSPRKERTKTWYRSIDFNAALQKLDSHRHSLDTSAKCTPKKQAPESEQLPATKERIKQDRTATSEESSTKPNFSIGGRVSLRERVENMNLSRLRPSKMSSSSGNGSPVPSATPVAVVKKVSDTRKIRPRSHSPLKNIKINLSPVKKLPAAGTPSLTGGDKPSKRESIGLFGRLNRMMHQHGLGGLGTGDKPTGKSGSLVVTVASKAGAEDGTLTSAPGGTPVLRSGTDKAAGTVGVSFGGNVSKQSTIQKLTQLSSCNRREQQQQQQQLQQSKTETTHERDRKSKQHQSIFLFNNFMWLASTRLLVLAQRNGDQISCEPVQAPQSDIYDRLTECARAGQKLEPLIVEGRNA